MKHTVTALGCGWCALIMLLAAPACSRGTSEIDEMIDIGTHSLHLRCIGEGMPAVVIDTGLGDVAANWHAVQEQLAQFTRVCTYDRAGYGLSEPGPMPRHAQRSARELKLLLESAGVKGPYVLVGHSLGGLNLQVFVVQYPDLAASLVLIDPPPSDFMAGKAFPGLYQTYLEQASELLAAAEKARKSTDSEQRAKAGYFAAVASEQQMAVTETIEQVTAIESFGGIPLTVVAAGKPNPAFGDEADEFQAFWIEQNRALTAKSRNSTFVLVEESGHHLEKDEPEAVVGLIREVIAQARA